jgi:hypothetical protein
MLKARRVDNEKEKEKFRAPKAVKRIDPLHHVQ